jgi:hypothetical protein
MAERDIYESASNLDSGKFEGFSSSGGQCLVHVIQRMVAEVTSGKRRTVVGKDWLSNCLCMNIACWPGGRVLSSIRYSDIQSSDLFG